MGLYQDIPSEPFFSFGYGCSYSSFSYSAVRLEGLTAEVTVTNTSDIDGEETVLWFVTDKAASVTQPSRKLKFFEKRMIRAGKSETFKWEIEPGRDLSFIDSRGGSVLESGEFFLRAGISQTEPVSLFL